MMRQVFAGFAGAPAIRISRVQGNLAVHAWDEPNPELRGESQNIKRDGGSVTISRGDHLALKMPRDATLHVDFVAGDLTVQDLNGGVDVSAVGGSVVFRNVSGQISTMRIGGNP